MVYFVTKSTLADKEQLSSGAALQTDLGISAYAQTLLDDTTAATARATLNITDWVTYTPTFTGWGTATGVSIWSRRIGDTLYIRGRFTTGTHTGTEARMTLGFNGVNGVITSDATKVPNTQMAGHFITAAVIGADGQYTLIESSVGYITFGRQDATFAGFSKRLGSDFANTSTFTLMAEVPVSGW